MHRLLPFLLLVACGDPAAETTADAALRSDDGAVSVFDFGAMDATPAGDDPDAGFGDDGATDDVDGHQEEVDATGETEADASVGPDPDAATLPPDDGPPREALGSFVVLGDSIGDGGGPGPRYYDLLVRNDDGLYPEWRGLDLETRFPGVRVARRAESGSETGALEGQIRGLPRDLPGPVAVTITSGGNDVKEALVQAATGLDAVHIAQMQANIGGALDALNDRYGDRGITVYFANVYDSSDGQGNFGLHCRFARQLGAIAIPTDPIFERWNAAHAAETARTGDVLVDLHGAFYGHGYNSNDNWYAEDCTHPNRRGHHELRALFWDHLNRR